MHAVRVRVVTFRENHAVEGTIKLNVHTHMGFFALDLKDLDLRHVVSRLEGPGLNFCAWRGKLLVVTGWGWSVSAAYSVLSSHGELVGWVVSRGELEGNCES